MGNLSKEERKMMERLGVLNPQVKKKQTEEGLPNLRELYNQVLKKEKKLEEIINTKQTNSEDFSEDMRQFKQVLKRLNQMIKIIEEKGYEMSHEEVVRGFKKEGGE